MQGKSDQFHIPISQIFWVAVGGGSLGWMLGLSHSPVLGSFLTPILGIVVAGLSALMALQSEKTWLPRVGSFLPIGVFILFCSVFATAGVWARSHQILVPAQAQAQSQYQNGNGGLFNSMSGGDCGELLGTEVTEIEIKLEAIGILDSQLGKALLAASNIDQPTFDKIARATCENL